VEKGKADSKHWLIENNIVREKKGEEK